MKIYVAWFLFLLYYVFKVNWDKMADQGKMGTEKRGREKLNRSNFS